MSCCGGFGNPAPKDVLNKWVHLNHLNWTLWEVRMVPTLPTSTSHPPRVHPHRTIDQWTPQQVPLRRPVLTGGSGRSAGRCRGRGACSLRRSACQMERSVGGLERSSGRSLVQPGTGTRRLPRHGVGDNMSGEKSMKNQRMVNPNNDCIKIDSHPSQI